jgi:hypothetical protein
MNAKETECGASPLSSCGPIVVLSYSFGKVRNYKIYGDQWLRVAKLVAHLLVVTSALWVRIQTSLKNHIWATEAI